MTTLITTLASFLTSFATTLLVDHSLASRIPIIGSLVGFEHTQNSGIAFGIDLPGWILAILIPLALIFIIYFAWKERKNTFQSVAFGLIIGGAFANIFDRFNDGFVTDFIQVGWWPVFNVADSCITVGMGMLILFEVLTSQKNKYQTSK